MSKIEFRGKLNTHLGAFKISSLREKHSNVTERDTTHCLSPVGPHNFHFRKKKASA